MGTVFGIVMSMLIGRWAYVLSPELHSINAWFMYIYYAIFIFSLMLSFVLGAARALPTLLLSIVIVLLLIPLTSAIALLLPEIGLWPSSSSLWWVDVFALLLLGYFSVLSPSSGPSPVRRSGFSLVRCSEQVKE